MEGTEIVFSRLANSAPISTHPARQLVLKTSKLKNGAGKLLDKNLVMVKRSKQGDVLRPLPSLSFVRLLRAARHAAMNPLVVYEPDAGSTDGRFGQAEQTARAGRLDGNCGSWLGSRRRGDGARRPPPLPCAKTVSEPSRRRAFNGPKPLRREAACTSTAAGPGGGPSHQDTGGPACAAGRAPASNPARAGRGWPLLRQAASPGKRGDAESCPLAARPVPSAQSRGRGGAPAACPGTASSPGGDTRA